MVLYGVLVQKQNIINFFIENGTKYTNFVRDFLKISSFTLSFCFSEILFMSKKM